MPNFLAEDEDQSDYLAPIDDEVFSEREAGGGMRRRPFVLPSRKPMGDAPLTDAPAPRPIGAGNQPTIRELLNPQPPQGPGLTSETEDGARPESDPATDAVRKAQEHAALIARAKPTMPEPKWWQRALAGAAGGAAGYVNASGRARVDPTGAIQGIYGVPQFQRKTQDWQNKTDAADLESAQASGNLTTLQRMRQLKTAEQKAAEESADRKTRMENDAAAKDEIETTKRQGQAVKQQEDLMKPFGADAYLQKEGTPVPPGYEIDQAPASPGMVIVHPARMQELTEDLAPYASGRKVGQKIPYTEWRKAQDKKADAEKSYNSKLDPAAKENENQWIADAQSPDPTIAGVAKKKLDALAKQRTAMRPQISINNGGQADDAKVIAEGIFNGDQPPDTKGLYRYGAAVRAQLERKGYHLAEAQRDWQAVNRHLATLNGQQQERLRQAITFTHDSVGQIENLYDEWQKTGLPTGFKSVNKAALVAASHLPGQQGAVAQALMTQINDLTSELGTVYKGGNGSTDESLRLAGENLKGEWNKETFERAVKQLKVNLTIRKNSILTSQPAGVRPDSPYLPKTDQPQQDTRDGAAKTASRADIQAYVAAHPGMTEHSATKIFTDKGYSIIQD